MKNEQSQDLRIGIAGLGEIGAALARALDAGAVPGCHLAAVAGRDPTRTETFVQTLKQRPEMVTLAGLADAADVIVECAPAAILRDVVLPALQAGKQVVVLSVGALLQHPDLLDGSAGPGQILVPSGALLGLDAVTAAAEGTIHSVRMVTRKPPQGLKGAPYLVANQIDISDVQAPLRVFQGTPREAAIGFPANLNVAVALSLAGIGPDRTTLEIWADPTVTRNTHDIVVDSDSARLTMRIENIPSANPKTGRITAQSVIALLRKLRAPVRIGT